MGCPTLHDAPMKPCPICGATTPDEPRYPRSVCFACSGRTTDAIGRSVTFSAEGVGGPVVGWYDDGSPLVGLDARIDGVAVRAGPRRMGGVVVQRVDDGPPGTGRRS